MRKQTGCAGGLAALNRGKITNCCSLVKVKTKEKTTGGLAGENTGGISGSYYSGPARRLNGGVSGSGIGEIKNSYYFHRESQNSARLCSLSDPELAKRFDTITRPEDAKELGFDTDNDWQYIGGSQVMLFNSEKWLFDIAKSPLYSQYLKRTSTQNGAGAAVEPAFTLICTAEELIEFAQKVNAGEPQAADAYIRLGEDIDLGGRAWQPIGSKPTKAFWGLFDGCGHTIKNFIVKSKDTNAKGLFGYLKGEVYNLNVDCVIKGGRNVTAGAVAAYCDKGVIGYCGAIAEIKCGGKNLGGLVGSNTGTIFYSYSAGIVSSAAIPWVCLAPLPMLLALLLLIPRVLHDTIPIFAPVPIDDGVVPVGNIDPVTDKNSVGFRFERVINVDLSTGKCLFNFVNPGMSNHTVVVQLHFTDTDAIAIMGSTGRRESQQQSLLENPDYDPENHRTVIAESGAIPPGHLLDTLSLSTHPNGASIPPGEYDAIVYLLFYDIDTNSRAMIESQFPVTLLVG